MFNSEYNGMDGLFVLLKELNYYNLLTHPNIIKPIAWTFDVNGYMAMPLGIPVKEAYENKLVTLKQIISDTLSALYYMDSMKVDHNDQRPCNMILYEGKIKFIDMGSAKPYSSIQAEISTLHHSYQIIAGFADKTKFQINSYIVSWCDQIDEDSINYISKEIKKITIGPFRGLKIQPNIFSRGKKWQKKVEPHLLVLNAKFELCNNASFYIMMSLI